MAVCKHPVARIAFALAAAATLASAAAGAEKGDGTDKARQAGDSRQSPRALEAEFWACDYAAFTRGLVGTDTQACLVNYEALKKAKFGGDFAALVSWWQRNKANEYAALSESRPTVAGR